MVCVCPTKLSAVYNLASSFCTVFTILRGLALVQDRRWRLVVMWILVPTLALGLTVCDIVSHNFDRFGYGLNPHTRRR